MQWQRSVVKKNGDLRKRFEQWGVPKEIRRILNLHDGDKCMLTARLGTFSIEPKSYKLTSGGEIRLPKDIAKDLRFRATANPNAQIVFNIYVEGSIRNYWVVSPNVRFNPRTVNDWRQASVKWKAAFMGWQPDDDQHRLGPKFARAIQPGDTILIARRFRGRPETVGFGTVVGEFKTRLSGFKPHESFG